MTTTSRFVERLQGYTLTPREAQEIKAFVDTRVRTAEVPVMSREVIDFALMKLQEARKVVRSRRPVTIRDRSTSDYLSGQIAGLQMALAGDHAYWDEQMPEFTRVLERSKDPDTIEADLRAAAAEAAAADRG